MSRIEKLFDNMNEYCKSISSCKGCERKEICDILFRYNTPEELTFEDFKEIIEEEL